MDKQQLWLPTYGPILPVPPREVRNELRYRVAARDKRICFYCQQKVTNKTRTVDHVIPLSRGGSWRMSNLRLSCLDCNGAKGNMTAAEWESLGYPGRKEATNG